MPSSANSSSSDDDDAPSTTTKLHDGYHGWMKRIPATTHDFTPARIDADAAAAQQSAAAAGNSAWNTAGTWEERDKSAWARERLKLLVLTRFRFEDEALGVAVAASAISRCEGEAKVIFSRGKKRCGYDITLKFAWTAKPCAAVDESDVQVTGHVEIHDFDDTNGEEYEVSVSVETSSAHATAVKNAVLQKEPELRTILAEWKSELLQQ